MVVYVNNSFLFFQGGYLIIYILYLSSSIISSLASWERRNCILVSFVNLNFLSSMGLSIHIFSSVDEPYFLIFIP